MVSGTEKAAGKREESKSCKIISNQTKTAVSGKSKSGNGGFVSVDNCKQLLVLILDSLNPHGNIKTLDRMSACTEGDHIHASFCNRADIVIARGFQQDFTVIDSNGFFHLVTAHIVQHDNVCTRCEGFSQYLLSFILDSLNSHGNVKTLDRVGECTKRDNIHASFCN